jgi:Lon protease-like protein
MAEKQTISLFPLRVVLFPGSKLDLQIFEQRYLDLVSQCLRNDEGFGVCLLREGEEVIQSQSKQTIHRTGTYARIVDWDQLENGLLGITVQGQAKFRIADCWQADSGVLEAEAEFSEQDRVGEEPIPLSENYAAMVDLLQSLENHPMIEEKAIKVDYDNLWELGWRLGELIPVDVEQKQELLETDDPWERISSIERLVSAIANEA